MAHVSWVQIEEIDTALASDIGSVIMRRNEIMDEIVQVWMCHGSVVVR